MFLVNYPKINILKLLRLIGKIVLISTLVISLIIGSLVGLLYLNKDKIIGLATEQLNHYLNSRVEVSEKIDLEIIEHFPEIAVVFHNVTWFGSVPFEQDTLAKLGELHMAFNAYDIWQGRYRLHKIRLASGYIDLKTNKEGATNYLVFKPTKDSANSAAEIDIRKIELQNIGLRWNDAKNIQHYFLQSHRLEASLNILDKDYRIRLNGDLHSHSMSSSGITFLKGKDVRIESELKFNTEHELLSISACKLSLGGHWYDLSGSLDIKQDLLGDFHLKSRHNSFQSILSLLPGKLSEPWKKYQTKGEVSFEAIMRGKMKGHHKPHIAVYFISKNASFYDPEIKEQLSQIQIKGEFQNGSAASLETSELRLDTFSFVMRGKPFTGKLLYRNFDNPYLNTSIKGEVDLDAVHDFFPLPEVEYIKGLLSFDLRFDGNIKDLERGGDFAKIKTGGHLHLYNGEIKSTRHPLTFYDMEARLAFDQNDIRIDSLMARFGKSDIQLKGKAANLIRAIALPNQDLHLKTTITSTSLDLDSLMAWRVSVKDSGSTGIRDLLWSTHLNCQSVTYGKVKAEKVKAHIHYHAPKIEVEEYSLMQSGGTMKGGFQMLSIQDGSYRFSGQTDFDKIDVTQLFQSFDDFGQDFLTSQHISGKLNAQLNFYFELDPKLNIIESSVACQADVTIKEGRLKDFAPMKELSKFMEESELMDIRFSDLSNRIMVSNRWVYIPEMLIQSSAANLQIAGEHSFDNQFSYRVVFPIKTLLKKHHKHKEHAGDALEQHPLGHLRLHLIIEGTPDDFKIKYDKKRTREKIANDMKDEKIELKEVFKAKEEEFKQVQIDTSDYFDFDE